MTPKKCFKMIKLIKIGVLWAYKNVWQYGIGTSFLYTNGLRFSSENRTSPHPDNVRFHFVGRYQKSAECLIFTVFVMIFWLRQPRLTQTNLDFKSRQRRRGTASHMAVAGVIQPYTRLTFTSLPPIVTLTTQTPKIKENLKNLEHLWKNQAN